MIRFIVFKMLLADFCIEPTANLLMTFNPVSSYYSTLSYYFTCAGVNPLSAYLNTAEGTITSLQSTVVNIYLPSTGCSTVISQLTASLIEMAAIQSTFQALNASIACAPINNQFTQGIEDGICSSFFNGGYIFWIGFYASLLCKPSHIFYRPIMNNFHLKRFICHEHFSEHSISVL